MEQFLLSSPPTHNSSFVSYCCCLDRITTGVGGKRASKLGHNHQAEGLPCQRKPWLLRRRLLPKENAPTLAGESQKGQDHIQSKTRKIRTICVRLREPAELTQAHNEGWRGTVFFRNRPGESKGPKSNAPTIQLSSAIPVLEERKV